MSVLKPRAKLISFRVSADEYERVRAACGAQGARSLSDFVRSGICWIVGNSNRGLLELIATTGRPPLPLDLRGPDSAFGAGSGRDSVTALECRLDTLAHEVQKLSRRLQTQPRPNVETEPAEAAFAAVAKRG